MLITKEIEIDMGHRVPNHKSKCANLHGHRYRIEIGVDDKVIIDSGASNEGMVIDFGDLKQTMIEQLDAQFDHGFILYDGDQFADQFALWKGEFKQKITFVPFIPTAENLAKYWYEIMEESLQKLNIQIKHVKVWETPTSTAIYQLN